MVVLLSGPWTKGRGQQNTVLNPSLRASLLFWILTLEDGGCRPVPLIDQHTDVHISIGDGEGTGSIAAAYLRPRDSGHKVEMIQMVVPAEYQEYWSQTKTVDINEIEEVVLLMVLHTWPQIWHGMWLQFNDNEAARRAILTGSSSVQSMNTLTFETWRLVA